MKKPSYVEGVVIYGTDFLTRTAASVAKFVMMEASDSVFVETEEANENNYDANDGEATAGSDAFQ